MAMSQEPTSRAANPVQSQSLYRKYRPTSFAADELVGQEHIARTLRNAIMLDRIAHAYLFCGPRGTGKTSTARLMAKAVNCMDPDPAKRPCNACDACNAINANASVDIIEIDAASNRGVDDIRDLREQVKYAPTQLRIKFYIIDEAHQLTRDAFNAFLKTLEEPPAHVKFVLATTDPDKLPETVASRCQRFDFRRIPLSSAVEHLRRVGEREGLEVEDEALTMIARQATGSLRDALGLLDQLALYGDVEAERRVITAEAVRQVLGLTRNDRLVGLVDALADRDAGNGLRLIAEASETGEDVHQLNRQLVGYLRTLLHLRAGGRAAEADDTASRQADLFSLAELANFVRIFSQIEGALNRGSFAQLPLEIAFVEAIVGPPSVTETATASAPARQPAARPPAQRSESAPPVRQDPPPAPREEPAMPVAQAPAASQPKQSEAAPVQAPEPAPAALSPADGTTASQRPASPAPQQASGPALEKIVNGWTEIRRDVKTVNSRIAALLLSVDPVAVNGEEVVLVASYEFHRNKLNEDNNRRVVEQVIDQHLGGTYRILCVAPDEVQTVAVVEPPAVTGGANGTDAHAVDPESVQPVVETAPEEAPEYASGPVPTPDEPPEPEPQSLESEDEQRIRAAKSIFGATELET